MKICGPPLLVLAVVIATASVARGQTPANASPGLAGTSWQLVQIHSREGKPVVPNEKTRYRIDFQVDGRLRARIDCNGGRGRWKSAGPGQIEFGAIGLTKKECPPASLQARFVKEWTLIRAYTIKANHLFLTLPTGNGSYEFRPLPPQEPVVPAVASVGPIAFDCSGGAKAQATFYETRPAMVLVERDGHTRPAFAVPAASGARYVARGLVFWEARGQATMVWDGAELECRRR